MTSSCSSTCSRVARSDRPRFGEKLHEMHSRDYPAGFPVRLALKDLELVGEVVSAAAAETPVLDVVRERFSVAARRARRQGPRGGV